MVSVFKRTTIFEVRGKIVTCRYPRCAVDELICCIQGRWEQIILTAPFHAKQSRQERKNISFNLFATLLALSRNTLLKLSIGDRGQVSPPIPINDLRMDFIDRNSRGATDIIYLKEVCKIRRQNDPKGHNKAYLVKNVYLTRKRFGGNIRSKTESQNHSQVRKLTLFRKVYRGRSKN
jgi:hypothetical protein